MKLSLILAVLLFIIALGGSWLIMCGAIRALAILCGFEFSWIISTILWVIFIIVVECLFVISSRC